jgi:hypothetical protein
MLDVKYPNTGGKAMNHPEYDNEAERDEELERERLSSLTTIDAALEGWRRALRIARETEAA